MSNQILMWGKNVKIGMGGGIVKSYQSILKDGNTVAWFDSKDLSTITKDGGNFVSRWNDKSSSGHDLIQATGVSQPVYSVDGILFDGVNDFLKIPNLAHSQPQQIYIVFKQISWVFWAHIIGSEVSGGFEFSQRPTSAGLWLYTGVDLNVGYNLPMNQFGIAKILINGTQSKFQINNTAIITGNTGILSSGNIIIGSNSSNTKPSNIQIKEIIFRKVSDSIMNETLIYNYLNKKYAIV